MPNIVPSRDFSRAESRKIGVLRMCGTRRHTPCLNKTRYGVDQPSGIASSIAPFMGRQSGLQSHGAPRSGRGDRHHHHRERAGVRLLLALGDARSEEHTSELQSRPHLVCRLLLEKKKKVVMTTNLHWSYLT